MDLVGKHYIFEKIKLILFKNKWRGELKYSLFHQHSTLTNNNNYII